MDPRLEAAIGKLHAAQDLYEERVKVYRAAQAAYGRSRSAKNRQALCDAEAAADALLTTTDGLHDEIARLEDLIEIEQQVAERQRERDLEPELNLF